MKASELRIGNLVMDGKDIEQVNARMIDMLVKIEADFEPIPLTEERLLKFGFTDEEDYLELEIHESLSIIYVGYLALMLDGVIIQINDVNSDKVHQLQNLYFALTGEELTLKSE